MITIVDMELGGIKKGMAGNSGGSGKTKIQVQQKKQERDKNQNDMKYNSNM